MVSLSFGLFLRDRNDCNANFYHNVAAIELTNLINLIQEYY